MVVDYLKGKKKSLLLQAAHGKLLIRCATLAIIIRKDGICHCPCRFKEGAMVHLFISTNPSLPHPEGADMEYVSSAMEMKQAGG